MGNKFEGTVRSKYADCLSLNAHFCDRSGDNLNSNFLFELQAYLCAYYDSSVISYCVYTMQRESNLI